VSEKAILSKSTFVKSVQCLKAFYLHKFYYNRRDPLSKEQQAVFNRGHEVGYLARSLFPNGKDASSEHPSQYLKSVQQTQNWINQGESTIYEAAFLYNGVLIYIDMLHRQDDYWHAYEVKSSLKISATYILDASLQYYVLKNALKETFSGISIINIDGQYQLEGGQLNPQQFFKFRDVSQNAEENLAYIDTQISKARVIYQNQQMPHVNTGLHCFKPYTCDFIGTCWQHSPLHSIFNMPFTSIEQIQTLLAQKKINLEDLSSTDVISKEQSIIIKSLKEKSIHIDQIKILSHLKSLSSSLIFFDCELSAAAIPIVNGNKPYEAFPYLISLTLPEGETFSYFLNHTNDYKPLFRYLIDHTKSSEHIICFDTASELILINFGIKHFPDLAYELEALRNKLFDFSLIFKQVWFYHYEQYGSFTLKAIAQSFIDRDFYKDLPVQSGLMASYAYQYYLKETDESKKVNLKTDLIQYCEKDTEAVAQLFSKVKQLLNHEN
jgi:hypothetical protein